MAIIKGWRKVRDVSNHVIYVKVNSPLRVSMSKLKPRHWNINLYRKYKDEFQYLENLARGITTKTEAKKFAVIYMRAH